MHPIVLMQSFVPAAATIKVGDKNLLKVLPENLPANGSAPTWAALVIANLFAFLVWHNKVRNRKSHTGRWRSTKGRISTTIEQGFKLADAGKQLLIAGNCSEGVQTILNFAHCIAIVLESFFFDTRIYLYDHSLRCSSSLCPRC